MNFKLPIFLLITFILHGCNSQQHSDRVSLKVVLSQEQELLLRDKFLYLFDVSKQRLVDSALVNNDSVSFNDAVLQDLVLKEVSLQRMDTFQGQAYLRPMGLHNPYNSKVIHSSFYLDRGLTLLKPRVTREKNEETSFVGSNQNEPLFKNVELRYSEQNHDRAQIIKKNIAIIKTYPYSIHLLKQLFRYKEKFLPGDLKNQLSNFNSEIKQTALFKSFEEYFSIAASFDKNFPSIEFESQNGSYQKVGNDQAAYQLVVYWASWCGPCRKEIPALKYLYSKYNPRGLGISSVSIDGNKRNWQMAMEQEKMPWQQLIAIDSTRSFIDIRYDIKTIPKAYLYDRNKQLIKKFDDAAMTITYTDSLFKNLK